MMRLSRAEWQEQAAVHQARVNEFASASRERASRGESHPVYDFFGKYYPFSFGKFAKWHPPIGVVLEEADEEWYAPPKYVYASDGSAQLSPEQMSEKERGRHRFTHRMLAQTQSRAASFGCFGLHEWAMVYTGAEVRHRESAPLRLSQGEIDEVVRSRPLVCTHFDAYRFFAPKAQPLNKHQPTMHDRERLEQPGCIHANMDLYKWAYKSLPWIGSDLVWECFVLAVQAREIDMRASPYDLRAWGYAPICIETDLGRAEYVQKQQEIEGSGRALRSRLMASLELSHCSQ